jgi:hypothetical protein
MVTTEYFGVETGSVIGCRALLWRNDIVSIRLENKLREN